MKELKRIGPLSLGKIFGMVGAVFGVIVGLVLALFSGALGEPFLGDNWFVQVILVTIFYAIVSFVGGVIYAALYNLVAGWVGGVRIELDDG